MLKRKKSAHVPMISSRREQHEHRQSRIKAAEKQAARCYRLWDWTVYHCYSLDLKCPSKLMC
jgi:hypothetical protein